jgi:hypothetical protein
MMQSIDRPIYVKGEGGRREDIPLLGSRSSTDEFRLFIHLFLLAQTGHQVPKSTLFGLAFH